MADRGAYRLAFGGLAAALLLALATAGVFGWRYLETPMAVPTDGEWLEVPPGTPLTKVTAELAARDVLTQPRLLSLYARLTGDATRIHAGEYQIAAGTSPRGLLRQLVGGQVFLHQVTVIEGWRFEELLAALRAHPAIEPSGLDGPAIMRALGKEGLHPEGQFYPDTYRFPRGTGEVEILQQAHGALEAALAAAWTGRRPDVVLKTPHDALILASIVEKETALAGERRRISGVFHRRLERGMRLQTDPTVIYGLGSGFDGNLRRADLGRDTPYNTYTRAGLPPTPIALPGGDALAAALDPAPGPELYFVATGRPDGSHFFSATLAEHNDAVARYLKRLRDPGEQ